MKIDLHVHTRYSDGSQTMEETLALARARGLNVVGITDHDTVEGLEEAVCLAPKYHLQVVGGIEISAYDYQRQRKVHILGYRFDSRAPHIRALCDPILAERRLQSISQVEALNRQGFKITLEEVEKEAGGSTCLYKQHIMAVLISKGYTDAIYSELYKTLFRQGGLCFGDMTYVDAAAAVSAIKFDGGQAFMAHPGLLDSYDMIEDLVEYGLQGIEIYHEDHGPTDYLRCRALASRYGLLIGGGSDYHGLYGGKTDLGGLLVPWEEARGIV